MTDLRARVLSAAHEAISAWILERHPEVADLPVGVGLWSLKTDPETDVDCVSGMIRGYATDDPMAAVTAWAEALGLGEPVMTSWGSAEAVGQAGGEAIRVWAVVDQGAISQVA